MERLVLSDVDAEASECDVIVSRNVSDFEGSPVQVMTPEEFLAYG